MEHQSPKELRLAARRALLAFYGLLVCVALTVSLTRIPFGHPGVTIAIALIIAVVQACLLAGFLMQLVSERKMIVGVLALTGVLFAVLMVLISGSYADHTSRFFS